MKSACALEMNQATGSQKLKKKKRERGSLSIVKGVGEGGGVRKDSAGLDGRVIG